LKIFKTKIPDVKIIQPNVFADNRGFFFESFNLNKFELGIGEKITFIQDNHSKSIKNVLRGLHYQIPPHAQGKLVRVLRGEVYDVAVDLRKSSPTFGHWVGEILSSENKKQLWVPEGFAHGFLTLSKEVEYSYKTTNNCFAESERNIKWNDSDLQINWLGNKNPFLSEKDKKADSFKNALKFD